jgi:hypothetical protein
MRLLIALAIIQSVLLGVIGVKVMALDARTEKLARTPAAATFQPEATTKSPTVAASGGLGAEDLRQVVREEIAVLLQDKASQAAYVADNAPHAAISSAEVSNQKAAVARDIDLYMTQGRIDEVEMVELQEKIGRLPPAERHEMLSRLTKALNSGKLKGQL